MDICSGSMWPGVTGQWCLRCKENISAFEIRGNEDDDLNPQDDGFTCLPSKVRFSLSRVCYGVGGELLLQDDRKEHKTTRSEC